MFKITALTVLITRISLFFLWDNALFLNQKNDGWHHMYTGVIVMIVSLILPKKGTKTVFALGLGLFVDELIHLFHMFGLTTESDYWSLKSMVTTMLGLLLVLVVESMYRRKSIQPA